MSAAIESPQSKPPTSKRAFWLSVILVLAITVVCFWILIHPHIVHRFQTWGYVGAFFVNLIASATIVLPVPGAAITVAMSSSLNPILLSIASGVGSGIGELTGYFTGRGGQLLIPVSQRPTYDRLHRLTEKYGAFVLFVMSAFPFPLFDLAGIVAGATEMAIWKFFLATALGKSIKYLFLILLGAGPLEAFQLWFNR